MAGREGTSFRTIVVLTLVPVCALLVFFGWLIWRSYRKEPAAVRRPPAAVSRPPAPIVKPRPEAGRPRPSSPAIAIIIDDVGFDGQHLDRAMAIDPNFNFAILPNAMHAARAAEMLHAGGFEILCHLPMEPRDGRVSPGPHAVLTSMSDAQIVETTRADIAAVPHASGVNNHMGSRATTNRRVMEEVMRALPQGMYFIDSLTTGSSIAATIAREMNVKTAKRQVFLDDVQSDAAVQHQLDLLVAAAKSNGTAIGIGHPHDVTLRVLAREVPRLRGEGFRFVRASQVVN